MIRCRQKHRGKSLKIKCIIYNWFSLYHWGLQGSGPLLPGLAEVSDVFSRFISDRKTTVKDTNFKKKIPNLRIFSSFSLPQPGNFFLNLSDLLPHPPIWVEAFYWFPFNNQQHGLMATLEVCTSEQSSGNSSTRQLWPKRNSLLLSLCYFYFYSGNPLEKQSVNIWGC